jgi:hypothetical protein
VSTIPQIKAKAELGEVDASEVRFLIRRLEHAKRIVRTRESELLEIKGPCINSECSLYYAHRGPCNCIGRLA